MATLINYTCKHFIKLTLASPSRPVTYGHLGFLKKGKSWNRVQFSVDCFASLCLLLQHASVTSSGHVLHLCLKLPPLHCCLSRILRHLRVTTMLYFKEFMILFTLSLFSKACLLFSSLISWNSVAAVNAKIKNLFMLSVRISSYGCTREVWARKMRKSCTRR